MGGMADSKEKTGKTRYEKAVQEMMKRYDMPEWAAKLHLDHWS